VNAGSVGTAVPRVGGRERVNGSQQFLADIRLENMLHVKLVTLDVACARIDSIDTSNALSLPGVACIVTPAELPQPRPRFGPVYKDRPILADGETTYHGEPICAVAAESRDIAEAAAEAVRVGYTELPGVFTIEAALAPNAPLVQSPSLRPDDPLARSNVLRERRFQWGTIDETDITVLDHTHSRWSPTSRSSHTVRLHTPTATG
jgi:CO/xanthine dehydrogenase Mo-binding subunit